MTDYELLYLWGEASSNAANATMDFVAILSAFLVASFFIGERLSKLLLIISVSIYSVFSFIMLLNVYANSRIVIDYAKEVIIRRLDGNEALQFLSLSQFSNHLDLVSFAITFVCLISYIASLIFIFHIRKKGTND